MTSLVSYLNSLLLLAFSLNLLTRTEIKYVLTDLLISHLHLYLQVVVRPTVSDLSVNVSGDQLISGEWVSVDVELFTTMKHLLILHLTLHPEQDNIDTQDHLNNTDKDYFTNANKNISNNTTNINNQLQNRNNIYCQGGTRFHFHSDTHLDISNHSSCHLRLHLQCRTPTNAGQYHLIASVFSTSDPSAVLLSTVLPGALMVHEPVRALKPSGSWKSAVSTHAEFSLEVDSLASQMGSTVVWTFSFDDVVMMNRTTAEWHVNVSLAIAGCYKVTVKAFNPVSWASLCTHILAQDPVGELVLNVPNVITTNQEHSVLFSVSAGSNVTVSLLVNATLLYRNSSYTTGDKGLAVLLFDHAGTVVVELQAKNRVSSQNKSVTVCVEGNRKPSPHVRVNRTQQPTDSQSPVVNFADNGEDVSLTNTH